MKTFRKPSLRALIATRRGALTLAALCALLAVGVVLFAMSQYRHSLSNNAQQSTVLVSTAEIQKGTSADVLASRSLYKVVPVLASQITPGAITDAGALVGKTAASTILPGEQLTEADFTAKSSASTVLSSPAERAIAVTLDPAHSVDGLLAPGEQVDVYGDADGTVGLLIADAVVLKGTVATGDDTYVLGVSDTLSPRVMWMFDNGHVWLELRGANATNPPATNTGRRQAFLGNYTNLTPTYPATTTGAQQ